MHLRSYQNSVAALRKCRRHKPRTELEVNESGGDLKSRSQI